MSFQFSRFDWFCFWYPPGWLILFNRHWQHYHPDPEGWNWLEFGLFLIPGGFYLALLLRWMRLGFRAPKPTFTEPDPIYQNAFREEILFPIVTRYFRAELHDVENLPTEPPAIVTLNHAGMCFPWDFVCLGVLLGRKTGWFVQLLAHPIFFDHPWLVWWLPPGWAQALGGVRAEKESFEAAIAEKKVLLYAPESWRGLVKGWRHRYQLAKYDPSFLRLSSQYQVPIISTVCIGNESLHPWALNSQVLAKWFRMPMLPVSPLVLIFVLFPSMGVWAVRSQLKYYVRSRQLPETELSRAESVQQAEQMRSQLQKEINQLVTRS